MSAEHEDSERYPSAKFTFQVIWPSANALVQSSCWLFFVAFASARWPPIPSLTRLIHLAGTQISPMAVVISEESVPLYHFLTNVCAIIGGLFTVFSMATGVLDATIKTIKKSQMGKLG